MGPTSHLRERLSQFGDRPSSDSPPAARWIAAALLVVVVALVGVRQAAPRHHRAAPAPVPSARAPQNSRPPVREALTQVDVRDVKRTARRFLSGYLPYTYGQRPARSVPATSPRLLDTLAHDPPRVPLAVHGRRPAITGTINVDEDQATTESIAVSALVDDGHDAYTVHVQLERHRGDWRASRVG